MVTVVVIHSQYILHGQDVAVGSQAKVLLDALGNHTRLEEVHGVLLSVGGGTAGQCDELVVDHNTQASEERHFGLGHAHTAAAPGDRTTGGQGGGAEGQHPDLLQVVSNVRVHCNRIELIATLAQLHLGANDVGDVQEVGLGH